MGQLHRGPVREECPASCSVVDFVFVTIVANWHMDYPLSKSLLKNVSSLDSIHLFEVSLLGVYRCLSLTNTTIIFVCKSRFRCCRAH